MGVPQAGEPYEAAGARLRSGAPAVSLPVVEIAVGAVALLARAWHLAALRASPLFPLLMGDAQAYDEWARRIAAGDWLGQGVFYQAPLYPYVLGVVYRLFGPSLLAVRIVQALLGSAACVLVARAGRRFFGAGAGLVAGLVLALYPTAIFLDGLIQKSSLDGFLVALLLLLLAPAERGRERAARWAGVGVVLGLLALTRENALALVAVALVALAVREQPAGGRAKLARAGLLAAGLACALVPVGLRNLAVGREFHLTTSQFGPNFYIGNGPGADGTYRSLLPSRGDARFEARDARELAERALGRPLSPGEVSRYWSSLTLRHIGSEPGPWLRLMVRKALLLVNRVELDDTEDQLTHADFSPPLRLVNPWLTFGLLVPLAGAGLVLCRAPWRHLLTLQLYLAVYAASVLAFYVFSRYRFPLVPVLALFAGAGLVAAGDELRRGPRRLLPAAAAALGLALVANWPLAAEAQLVARATSQNNIAGALLRAGAPIESALAYQTRAVQLHPRFAAARRNLGAMLRALGRPAEGLEQLQAALALAPTADVHVQIALALVDLGRPGEAAAAYAQAAALDPGDATLRQRQRELLSRTPGP